MHSTKRQPLLGVVVVVVVAKKRRAPKRDDTCIAFKYNMFEYALAVNIRCTSILEENTWWFIRQHARSNVLDRPICRVLGWENE